MGTFSYVIFIIIFSTIFLNLFDDVVDARRCRRRRRRGHGHGCGCGCRCSHDCHDRRSSSTPLFTPFPSSPSSPTSPLSSTLYSVSPLQDQMSSSLPYSRPTELPRTTPVAMPQMICLSAYDALLIVADINQLITNIRNSHIKIEVMFSPMFKVANVFGCYKLSVNGSYAQIFDQPVKEFLNDDVIAGINPLLVESNEQSKSCPNETDAKMLIAMNFCAIGISFVDQLDDNPNLLNDVLVNAQEQLANVKKQLSGQYDAYYAKLATNGYETQLNKSTILERIIAGWYRIMLCKETGYVSTTVASTTPTQQTTGFTNSPLNDKTTTGLNNEMTSAHGPGETSTMPAASSTLETNAIPSISPRRASETSPKTTPLQPETLTGPFQTETQTGTSTTTQMETTTTATASTTPSLLNELNSKQNLSWSTYAVILNRTYPTLTTVVKSARNFARSTKQIQSNNVAFEDGKTTYQLGYTNFSDHSITELPRGKAPGHPNVRPPGTQTSTTNIHRRVRRQALSTTPPPPPPQSVDWRTQGAVTMPKDQGECGSCYTFGSVAVLEALGFFATGNLTSFSEQQFVDCTWSYGNNGCYYGFPEYVFNYMLSTPKQGCTTESDYPYTGTGWEEETTVCNYVQSLSKLNISEWGYASCDWLEECPQNDELSMMRYVAKAPLAIIIYSSCFVVIFYLKFINYYALYVHQTFSADFQNYVGGVYYNNKCCSGITSAVTDHVVTVVGYGTDPDFGDYWTVKNSWSSEWGENGFVRIKRGVNHCGIATSAVYAY